MKYFVSSDIHGFYTEYKQALDDAGFDINNPKHGLIICGDLFDRGKEANKLLEFLLSIPDDRLVLIRGNHEDLLDDCIEQIKAKHDISFHHISNGTLGTVRQLTGTMRPDFAELDGIAAKSNLAKYYTLIGTARDYAECVKDGKHYIFVHGWIPLNTFDGVYKYNPDWRTASEEEWEEARWLNGMDMNHLKLQSKDDIIYCGHWHTSYGHHNYGKGCSEFGDDADFSIYYNDGIIALDACTAYSHKVNIEIFEGEII